MSMHLPCPFIRARNYAITTDVSNSGNIRAVRCYYLGAVGDERDYLAVWHVPRVIDVIDGLLTVKLVA